MSWPRACLRRAPFDGRAGKPSASRFLLGTTANVPDAKVKSPWGGELTRHSNSDVRVIKMADFATFAAISEECQVMELALGWVDSAGEPAIGCRPLFRLCLRLVAFQAVIKAPSDTQMSAEVTLVRTGVRRALNVPMR
jgi:hypothetical protein